MKTFKISLIVVSAFLAISCHNSKKSDSHKEPIIQLNEGKKWKVNNEMIPFINKAQELLMQYDGSNFKNLSELLESENKKLIKSCTMNGKSHDELHKWLHPHMQLIESLKNAENILEANKIIIRLKSSFQNYHTYFQ
jgi:hypothetical protein